jgi:hypothetical protein
MRTLTPLICAVLALAAGSVYVGRSYADAPAPAAGTLDTLQKNTIVRLRLDTDLEAGKSKPGDLVQFTVDKDVYGPDHVLLLTKGMKATGQVTASTAHDRFGRRGRLTFTCKSVQAAGVQVPVNLVVGSGSGAAAEAADEMDAQQFYSFRLEPLDPDGYVQSANPDGYYTQPQGSVSTTIYDPARQFSGSLKVTAKRGTLYTAHVARDISVPAA